ncbi:MAG: class B sortase [Ruminococcus sp.]|nr:class B sortase [Ruminococcus sp.]
MSDTLNDLLSELDREAKLRAEKISRIRNAIHGAQEQNAPAAAPPNSEKKVFSSAEDILRALDGVNAPSASGTASAEETPEITDEPYDEVHSGSIFDTLPDDPAADFMPDEAADVIAHHGSAPETEKASVPVSEPADYSRNIAAQEEPVRAELTFRDSSETDAAGKAEVKKSKKKKQKKKKTFRQRIRGLFPQKGDSVFECIRKVVFLVSVIAIIVCGYMVSDYYLDLWRSKRLNDKVMNMYWTYQDEEPEKPSEVKVVNEDGEEEIRKKYSILPGARKLLDINSDVVGVISIPDTNVNNPLMQADDNSKYLNMKIDGSESRAGEIFLDYRNHFDEIDDEGYLKYPNSDNLVIYGHNMGDESMFGTLKYYHRNGDYYGEHPVIELNSNCMTYKYKIFAFFMLDAEDDTSTKFDCWNKLNFSDEKDFYNFVNEAKRRTLRLNDVDVKYGDKLVTLSTCNTYLGDRGRLIIMGRLVREGEDPMKGTQNSVANPNIKWPTMYYNTKTNEHYDHDADFEPYGP